MGPKLGPERIRISSLRIHQQVHVRRVDLQAGYAGAEGSETALTLGPPSTTARRDLAWMLIRVIHGRRVDLWRDDRTSENGAVALRARHRYRYLLFNARLR